MKEILLSIRDLKVYYKTMRGFVKAVDGVDLDINKGEVVGLIGESGSGKSTLGFSILRLLPNNAEIISGNILLNGRDILELTEDEIRKIRWKEVSIIFQGAMNALNPVMRVGDQIAEVLIEHDEMSRSQALERARELLELVGIEGNRIDSYPHQLSGGMKQRVVIAMALALNPSLLIADEPVTALDVIVQAQIIDVLRSLKRKLDIAILFITHDISLVAGFADKVAIMYAGKIVEFADVDDIFYNPLHPYTKALINAVPRLKGEKREMEYIPGDPPDLINPPSGCRFHPRCPYAIDKCRVEEPPKKYIKGGYVMCHLV